MGYIIEISIFSGFQEIFSKMFYKIMYVFFGNSNYLIFEHLNFSISSKKNVLFFKKNYYTNLSKLPIVTKSGQ